MRLFLLLSLCFLLHSLIAQDSCKGKIRAEFVCFSTCQDQDIGLFNTSFTSTKKCSYNWKFGDGSSSNIRTPVKSFSKGGRIYKVELILYDSGIACRDTFTTSVNIFRLPNSGFQAYFHILHDSVYRYYVSPFEYPKYHYYTWYLPNGDSLAGFMLNQIIFPDTLTHIEKDIRLKVSNNLGCVSESSLDYSIVGVQKITDKSKIKILGNPSSNGHIKIINNDIDTYYEITSMDGKIMKSSYLKKGENQLDINTKGIYYLILDKGKTVFKIMIL